MDDQTLARQFAAGDENAFNDLVLRHRGWVQGMALKSLGDEATAQDIAQNVFVKVYFKIHQFRFEAEFKTWIYRILVNELNHWYRKNKMITWFSGDADEYHSYRENSRNQSLPENAGTELRKHVKKLPRMQRSIVVLRVFQELPFKDIGKILGITENSAKVNFFKAKKNLKKWMKGKMDE